MHLSSTSVGPSKNYSLLICKITSKESALVKMGKRRGGEAILRNILNLSRSKDGNGKGSKTGSLWCPYGRQEEEEGNAAFYCRLEPAPNSTPTSPENPNLLEEEDVEHLELGEMAKKEEDVEESSRRIIGLSDQLSSSQLLIKRGLETKPGIKRQEDDEKAREDCENIIWDSVPGAKEETHDILLDADENEEQNYENFGRLTDKTFSFLGAGSFERCDPLCDSELAAALHSFSSLSLGLSLDTLASRRERLAARSSDILRGPQRLTARSSEALRSSMGPEKSSLEMRSSLPMLPTPCSPERWEGILNKTKYVGRQLRKD